MSGKIFFNGASPVTQKNDAVESLVAYLGKEISGDGVLDLGSFKLVKSNKGDAFYGVTAKACSCPSAAYRPGQTCKHQRKYFGAKPASRPTEAASIRPTAGWIGPDGQKANGPVEA